MSTWASLPSKLPKCPHYGPRFFFLLFIPCIQLMTPPFINFIILNILKLFNHLNFIYQQNYLKIFLSLIVVIPICTKKTLII